MPMPMSAASLVFQEYQKLIYTCEGLASWQKINPSEGISKSATVQKYHSVVIAMQMQFESSH